jgi:hypothetical protein
MNEMGGGITAAWSILSAALPAAAVALPLLQ